MSGFVVLLTCMHYTYIIIISLYLVEYHVTEWKK